MFSVHGAGGSESCIGTFFPGVHQRGRIIYYDGLSPEADMIQRAGPRLAEGTRLLAEQIYPELFS